MFLLNGEGSQTIAHLLAVRFQARDRLGCDYFTLHTCGEAILLYTKMLTFRTDGIMLRLKHFRALHIVLDTKRKGD